MWTTPLKPKTKRRGLPKTRSGCRTCKKRRVKCGEEKPECLRCTHFGVQCDGYERDGPKPEGKAWILMTTARRTLLLPKGASSPLAKNPSESLFCVEKDHHYFEVFCTKTCFQILPFFDAGVFRQMVLQAAVADDALRHAVVALGAMGKKMETLDEFRCLSLDEQDKSSHIHHLNALKEYSVAISKMRASTPKLHYGIYSIIASLEGKSNNIRIALLTSLMIFCFEAWNGNLDFAVRQIQTGLRLIKEWHQSAKGLLTGPVSWDPAYTGSLEGELIRIFTRLDTQIVSFSEKPSPEYHSWIIARGRKVLESMPTVFKTLTEARIFEEAIIRRGMAFVCHEIPFEKPPPPLHTFPMNGWWGCREPKVLATLNRMATDSMLWRTAFAPVWKRLQEENNPSDLFPAALTRNRILSSHIGCVVTTANEEDLDHYHEDFKIMVEMSEYMLGTLEATGEKLKDARYTKSPKFNFDSYTVIPMFLTALKCWDPLLRRKAISLLLKYPRREGVCDSICMGRLCEWAMKIEEKHIDENGKVPSWARVHGVTLEHDPAKENSGTITSEQRVDASSDEVVIKSTQMAWSCSDSLPNTGNEQSEHWMGCVYQNTT